MGEGKGVRVMMSTTPEKEFLSFSSFFRNRYRERERGKAILAVG